MIDGECDCNCNHDNVAVVRNPRGLTAKVGTKMVKCKECDMPLKLVTK